MPEVLPIHPVTGLAALGVLRSGRIVWPVLGASPEDGDDTDGSGQGDDGAGDDDGATDVSLGLRFEAGRKALDAERKARRDAEKARKAAEKELADFKAAQQSKKDGDDAAAAAEQARRDAEAAATAKANARILKAELKAAAADKLADPSDAAAFIDLSQFEPDANGEFDASEISEAISDLIKRKPHLAKKGSGFEGSDSGGGQASRRQLSREQLKNMTAAQINKAREEGRLDKLLSGG